MKKKVMGLGIFVFLVMSATTVWAQLGIDWYERPGSARDIAIGGDGGLNSDVVYMIGKQTVDIRYGSAIYRWNNTYSRWDQIGGLAVAVTVTPSVVPWVVNAEGKIFEMVNSRWIERRGPWYQKMRAKDIGVGHDGRVYIISRKNGHIYYWRGSYWRRRCNFYQGAVRIDVDYQGNPWVVNSKNFIFHYYNGQWIDMTTPHNMRVFDVGIDCNGWDVFITRAESYPEGGRIYYTVVGNNAWYGSMFDPDKAMKGVRLDVSDGVIWLVTASGKIYQGIMI